LLGILTVLAVLIVGGTKWAANHSLDATIAREGPQHVVQGCATRGNDLADRLFSQTRRG
jgi:hypothetical protein